MHSIESIKIIIDKLFKILCMRYQLTQLYLEASFSLPTQASLFLICTGDRAKYSVIVTSCQGLIYFKRLFLNLKGLSDGKVVSLTKKKYSSAVHFL